MKGTDFRQTLKLGAIQLGFWNPNQDELTPVAKVALPVLSLIGAFYLHAKRVISHRALAVLSATILVLSYRFFITATQKKNTSFDPKNVPTNSDGGTSDRKASGRDGSLRVLEKKDLHEIFKANPNEVGTETQLKEGLENLSQLTVQQDKKGSTVSGEMDFSDEESD